MMRPFTLICMLSAFGSGLYLYQSKHQAQMLDREIGRTIKQAEVTRDLTARLRADWAVLNEPDRLAELARAHTSLQTLKPTQFAGLADLAARLPAPVADSHEALPVEAALEEPQPAPVVQASPSAPPVKPRDAAAAEPKPKPEAKPDLKPDSKPAAVAEAKPLVRHVDKPVTVAQTTATTTAAAVEPAPVRARPPHPPTEIVNSDATAPGTVGAAVLRAMRAQNAGAFTPPAYPAPSYTPPAYVQPAYAQPNPAQPAYAPPAASMLGGRALPPPVPFAAR